MENKLNKKANGWALLPFLVFVGIYLGAGIYNQVKGVEMAFYQFPAVTAMFIAVLMAFLMTKGKINDRFKIFARGIGNQDVITMLMIYLLAGAFSAVAEAMGGKESIINLGLSLVPVQFLTAGVFIISAFLGTATGTSMGTIGAIIPVAVGVAAKGGLSVPMMVGACVGGAMFGDNLSMISDTTIAATRSQGCEMKDKFRVNLYIALPAAVITFVLLLIFGRPETAPVMKSLDYNFIKVIPYLLVLLLALIGINVFLVLLIGIFAAGGIGMAMGNISIFDFSQKIWDGFKGMEEVFFLTLLCAGMSELIIHNGGIAWLINSLKKIMKGNKSAQLGIASLVSLSDLAVANNTIAIVLSGKVSKDISREYKIDPRKTASLLDIFSCVFQGLIPYGAQLLLAVSLSNASKIAMAPTEVITNNWYCWILALFAIISVFVPYAERICKKNPWNWDKDCAESDINKKAAEVKNDAQ